MVNGGGNVTEVQDWWKKLIDETKDLVGLAGFREMVDNMFVAWSSLWPKGGGTLL